MPPVRRKDYDPAVVWAFLGILAGGTAFVVLLVYLILAFSAGLTQLFAGRHIEDGEEIGQTGLVPPGWFSPGKRGGAHPRLKKHLALRRLGKVIRYHKHTPLVQSETDRLLTIVKLKSIRAEWKKRSWPEIYPWGQPAEQ